MNSNSMVVHPETGLTHSQMMVKRQNIWEELCSPSLKPQERAAMKFEYDKLLKITAHWRPA